MKRNYIIFSIILIFLIIFGSYYIFRTKQITNYPSEGTDIIAFGDSLVEGYGSTDNNDFVSLLSSKIGQPIINLGNSGDTTEDGIARLNQLDKYNPKVVILLLGGNDSLRKMPIDDTFRNLSIIIENIQGRGAIVILLGVRGGIFNDRFDSEFNNLRKKYQTAFVSDVLDGLFGNDKYMSDTIHPNNTGYQMISDRTDPILINLLK